MDPGQWKQMVYRVIILNSANLTNSVWNATLSFHRGPVVGVSDGQNQVVSTLSVTVLMAKTGIILGFNRGHHEQNKHMTGGRVK
jgi:hypothetical protein